VLVAANLLLGAAHIHRRRRATMLDAVHILSDDSLPSHIRDHPNGTLVNFHTPNCPYCKTLAPKFEAAAKELQKRFDTSLASIDSSVAPLAMKQYSVSRFPTLLWFRHGELIKDVPPSVRSTSKIIEFVDDSLQLAVINFSSRVDFDEAVPQLRSVLPVESLPVVVGFGREPGVYKSLGQVGEKFRGETAFLFVKEARAEDPYIRAYFRDAVADQNYNGGLSSQEVHNWLQPFMERTTKKHASK